MIAEKVIKKELSNKAEQEKLMDGLIDEIKLNWTYEYQRNKSTICQSFFLVGKGE